MKTAHGQMCAILLPLAVFYELWKSVYFVRAEGAHAGAQMFLV